MSEDADIALRSPGEVMLYSLVEQLCADGAEHFDLGYGDSAYKQGWCETVPLRKVERAITPRGRLLALGDRGIVLARKLALGHPALAVRVRQARYFVKRALSR